MILFAKTIQFQCVTMNYSQKPIMIWDPVIKDTTPCLNIILKTRKVIKNTDVKENIFKGPQTLWKIKSKKLIIKLKVNNKVQKKMVNLLQSKDLKLSKKAQKNLMNKSKNCKQKQKHQEKKENSKNLNKKLLKPKNNNKLKMKPSNKQN